MPSNGPVSSGVIRVPMGDHVKIANKKAAKFAKHVTDAITGKKSGPIKSRSVSIK